MSAQGTTYEAHLREVQAYLIGHDGLATKNYPPHPLTLEDWCIYGPFGTVSTTVNPHAMAIQIVTGGTSAIKSANKS